MPTASKGAFVSADDFYGFMQDQARGNPVEVAAFALKGKNDKEHRYFVMPWNGNTWKRSYAPIDKIGDYVPGYSRSDVTTVIHTHMFGTEPSPEDKQYSDHWKVPVIVIGPKGEDFIYFGGVVKPYTGD